MRAILAASLFAFAAACSPPANEAPDTTITETPAATPPAPTVVMITESDARTRAEAAGYTDITGLTQNADGTWTATGTKDGATTQITINDSGVSMTTTPAPTTP